ncbi:hypothetical protein SOVF_123910 isoform A [Spinacia oleracea]|nr:hypothetical protein SOVF_123910 isoform A [Spinacia oleracea]
MAWNLNFVDLRKIDGVTAVVYNGKPQTPEVVVDETWFSDPNLCRKTKVCESFINKVLLSSTQPFSLLFVSSVLDFLLSSLHSSLFAGDNTICAPEIHGAPLLVSLLKSQRKSDDGGATVVCGCYIDLSALTLANLSAISPPSYRRCQEDPSFPFPFL